MRYFAVTPKALVRNFTYCENVKHWAGSLLSLKDLGNLLMCAPNCLLFPQNNMQDPHYAAMLSAPENVLLTPVFPLRFNFMQIFVKLQGMLFRNYAALCVSSQYN